MQCGFRRCVRSDKLVFLDCSLVFPLRLPLWHGRSGCDWRFRAAWLRRPLGRTQSSKLEETPTFSPISHASTTAETSSAPAISVSWSISLCSDRCAPRALFYLAPSLAGAKAVGLLPFAQLTRAGREVLGCPERSWGALRAVCAWWRGEFRVAVLSRPHANDHCCAWLHRLVTVASPVLHRSNKPE